MQFSCESVKIAYECFRWSEHLIFHSTRCVESCSETDHPRDDQSNRGQQKNAVTILVTPNP